jgi:hypothetical protein
VIVDLLGSPVAQNLKRFSFGELNDQKNRLQQQQQPQSSTNNDSIESLLISASQSAMIVPTPSNATSPFSLEFYLPDPKAGEHTHTYIHDSITAASISYSEFFLMIHCRSKVCVSNLERPLFLLFKFSPNHGSIAAHEIDQRQNEEILQHQR